MIKIGFKRSVTDPYVYYRIKNDIIIRLYIDNMLILAPKDNQQVIDDIKKNLRRRFKLKELGKVSKILGMRVTRDRTSRAVYLDQTSYIKSFLYQFGMEQSKARSILI